MSKYQENVGPYDGLTVKNAALLLIDHQVGLMQLVRDMGQKSLRTMFLAWLRQLRFLAFPLS
jgi:hypothetical protein